MNSPRSSGNSHQGSCGMKATVIEKVSTALDGGGYGGGNKNLAHTLTVLQKSCIIAFGSNRNIVAFIILKPYMQTGRQ